MSDQTEVDIDVSVNGTSSLQKAADALANVNQSLRETARSLTTVVNGLDKLEKNLAQTGRSGSRNIDSLTKSVQNYSAAVQKYSGAVANDPNRFSAIPSGTNATRAAEVQRRQAAAASDSALRTQTHNEEQLQKTLRASANEYFKTAFAGQKYAGFIDGVAPKQQSFFQQLRAGTALLKNSGASLISLRYALYDVGQTYAIASAALLGFTVLSIKTAADFESAFTSVERTLDDAARNSTTAIADIRESLVDLSTQIPVTFDDITKIATLGNQLGIGSKDIKAFTATVAQFATVTGISVDETAQAFGLLGNLLGVASNQYVNLASSIALVGRRSVATEPQIIAVAEQIAAAAKGAGFSAEQVIGLSAALASLKVPPEQARGSLSIYFNALNKAVAEGGPKLAAFSKVTGLTVQQINDLVRSGKGGDEVLSAFLHTMNSADSVEITQALDALGLSQVRVDNTFRRLIKGVDKYDKTQKDSAQGFKEATEIGDQYAKILDNLNTQFQLLINSLNALVAEATSGAVPGIAAFIGKITEAVNAVRDFVKQPIVKTVISIGLALATTGGLILAYKAATALATASTFALVTAQAQLAKLEITGGIRGLAAAMGLIKFNADGATLSSIRLRSALLSLGKATVVLALIAGAFQVISDPSGSIQNAVDALGGLFDVLSAVTGAWEKNYQQATAVLGVLGRIGGPLAGIASLAAKATAAIATMLGILSYGYSKTGRNSNLAVVGITKFTRGVGTLHSANTEAAASNDDLSDSFDGVGDSAGGAARTLVDYASDLSQVFGRATDIRFGSTAAIDSVTSKFIDLNRELAEYQAKVLKLNADKSIQEYFLSVANLYGDTLRAGEIQAELADITLQLADAQAVTNKTLTGNSKAAITNRGVIVDLLKGYQDYIQNLAASGATQDVLNGAVQQSKTDFLAQAQALGFSNAELQPYVQSFNDLTYAINNVPRNITVGADINPAVTAIKELLSKLSSGGYGSATVPVTADPVSAEDAGYHIGAEFGRGVQRGFEGSFRSGKGKTLSGLTGNNNTFNVILNGIGGYADGGRIGGQGTGTSDSNIIRASRGEFMVNESAASANLPVLNYLNKYGSLPAFAAGGPTTSAQNPNVIAHLSTRDRAIMGAKGDVIIQIDGREVARAVNKANTAAGYQGVN